MVVGWNGSCNRDRKGALLSESREDGSESVPLHSPTEAMRDCPKKSRKRIREVAVEHLRRVAERPPVRIVREPP